MLEKVKKGEYLEILLRYKNTVFSVKEIVLLWGESAGPAFRNRLNDYVAKGKLIRLRRGIYAKDKNYVKEEFATKIYTPAYISLETVLLREAVSFQYYSQIFVATNRNLSLKVDGQKYELKKMPINILLNKKGINQIGSYNIASKERALLDVIYLHKYSYFDNLRGIDWKKIDEILPIYKSERVEKIIKRIREQHK